MKLLYVILATCSLIGGCESRQNDTPMVEKCQEQEQNVTVINGGKTIRGHAPKGSDAPFKQRENPALVMNAALEAVKKKGTLVIVTDPRLYPLEFKSGDDLVGFDIDYLSELAKRFEIKVKFLERPWEKIYETLESGEADLAVAGIKTASETDPKFHYIEYGYMPQVFVSSIDKKVSHERQLVGKTVGVLTGSKSREMFESFKTNGLAIKRIYGHANETLLTKALEEGLVDVAVMDQQAGKFWAKKHSGSHVSGYAIVHEPLGIAIRKDNPGLTLLLERTVRAMRQEGTTSKLFEEWFGHPLGH